MAQPQPPRDNAWHLDKRVNVSIILALVVQAALGLTWANRMSFDIEQVKKDQETIQQQLDHQKTRFDLLIEVKTRLERLREDVKELREVFRNPQ